MFLLFILGCFVCFLDFMQLCLRKQQGSSLRAGGECSLWARSIGAIDRWRHSAYTHGKIFKKASTVSRCTHSDTYNLTMQHLVPFMLILSRGQSRKEPSFTINPKTACRLFPVLRLAKFVLSDFPGVCRVYWLVGSVHERTHHSYIGLETIRHSEFPFF